MPRQDKNEQGMVGQDRTAPGKPSIVVQGRATSGRAVHDLVGRGRAHNGSHSQAGSREAGSVQGNAQYSNVPAPGMGTKEHSCDIHVCSSFIFP